jgi:hypothetical protein
MTAGNVEKDSRFASLGVGEEMLWTVHRIDWQTHLAQKCRQLVRR